MVYSLERKVIDDCRTGFRFLHLYNKGFDKRRKIDTRSWHANFGVIASKYQRLLKKELEHGIELRLKFFTREDAMESYRQISSVDEIVRQNKTRN